MSNTTNDFDKQVDIKVKEELEKKELDKKLDTIMKSSKIYPDIIKSLSGLRKSVESLTESIIVVEEKQNIHLKKSIEDNKDLNMVFEKVRKILKNIDRLEEKITDRNNSNSLVEVIIKLFNEQNDSMVNQNNSKSIVSLLKKSGRSQSLITWGLITIVTILGIINKLFSGV